MSNVSVHEPKDDPNAIVLRLSKESFGEFIRDLISEHKRIRRDIKGSFVLDREELLDLISLINQRVGLQNQVALSTIALSVLYRDGYLQEFHSLDAFNASRDARQSEACAAHCTLTYVIRFPGREKPEKQEVSFLIRNIRAFEQIVTDKESLSLLSVLGFFYEETGTARIELEYTEISWGYDVENLIFQYLIQKFSRAKQMFARLRFLAISFLAILSVFLTLLYTETAYRNYVQQNLAIAATIIDQDKALSSSDKILRKIDLAISSYGITLSAEQWYALSLRAFGIVVVLLTLALALTIRRQSFLLLNDYTRKLYGRYLRRFEYVRYALITSFFVGLAASLGASFLYEAIKHPG